MERTTHLILNLLFACLLLTNSIKAQTVMTITPLSGSKNVYSLNNIRKLVFSGTGNIEVSKTDGNSETLLLSNTKQVMFIASQDNTAVSTPKKDAAEFHLFPNPVKNILTILLTNKNNPVTVELLSVEGKLLYREIFDADGNDHQINISTWNRGMYLCRVNNGKNIQTAKFIKI